MLTLNRTKRLYYSENMSKYIKTIIQSDPGVAAYTENLLISTMLS